MTSEREEALVVYVDVPSRHFVLETGSACIIISTIHFFIVAPTKSLISYIRVLTSDCGVVLYVRYWTVSSASTCPDNEHCPSYEMCFFSKSTHLTVCAVLKRGWHGNHWVTHTHQIIQNPYFTWQLMIVTYLSYSAVSVGDQLYGLW
jgi:hypothetical protein